MLLDTLVVDDHLAMVLSTLVGSSEVSSTNSRKKIKLSELEYCVRIELSSTGSAYSDPFFMKNVADSMLFPTDRKRFVDISPI